MTETRHRRLRVDRMVAVALALAALALLAPLAPGAWWWMAYGEYAPMLQETFRMVRAQDETMLPCYSCNWGREKRFDWLPGPTWVQVSHACLYREQDYDVTGPVRPRSSSPQRDYVFKDGALVALGEGPPGIDEMSLAPMLDTAPDEAICFDCASGWHDACAATFSADGERQYELAKPIRLSGLPLLKPGDYRCICHRTGPCARKSVQP